MTNYAKSRSDTGTEANDQASYFIGAGSIPNTGSNELIFGTILAICGGSLGLVLRKFARGY